MVGKHGCVFMHAVVCNIWLIMVMQGRSEFLYERKSHMQFRKSCVGLIRILQPPRDIAARLSSKNRLFILADIWGMLQLSTRC